ncbi:hypothetical protein [Pseudarthrobacter sp. W1I19]|uniref:hypothetical protein n=1 Tax=Pseudarthrobacter sp. W1I19 TaxID=3042288 RepID=UPI0027D7CFE3|nr:hypothetical protein [Pseudarthrobacter sp. W1I19]
MVSHFSKKDFDLIGDYAKLKGWRFGLADSVMRIAYFYDKNEKCIRKTFSEMEAELNHGGDAKDGQHSRRR